VNKLEAMIASPPERENVVVQYFCESAGQWAELYVRDGKPVLEVYSGGQTYTFDASEVIAKLKRGCEELAARTAPREGP
jgi:hypothetical protein